MDRSHWHSALFNEWPEIEPFKPVDINLILELKRTLENLRDCLHQTRAVLVKRNRMPQICMLMREQNVVKVIRQIDNYLQMRRVHEALAAVRNQR